MQLTRAFHGARFTLHGRECSANNSVSRQFFVYSQEWKPT
jgi:hypothetical protein